jgi:diaminohydroxyphosphoribosylaminopyrimidine deaminase / 5-amino-6-(5-phosphoribosylamino)uracil reductase
VGCVLVRDGETLGEGWHHRRGEPHAEVEALRDARARGVDVAGATAYVSLEPCDHHGRTPPCSEALVAAGIARVVIGALDPNPKTAGGGVRRLREAGIEVEVRDDAAARALIERFAWTIAHPNRPFVTLKMAMSLDGYVAARPGAQQWLTGPAARERVRRLRAEHDAVMVGAGTVRVDDPLLTVRPHITRAKPYTRVVACETAPFPRSARVLATPSDAPPESYDPTIVLAPTGARAAFAALEAVADMISVGEPDAAELDLAAALAALRERGISSVLCEGGPTLAGRLLAAGLVQRVVWLIAPTLLRTDEAIPVLAGAELAGRDGWRFDRIERIGDDMLLSADLTACSPA